MIPQIYVMAAITLVVALGFWSGLVYLFSGHQKHYFWLLLLGLPLSAIANLVIKRQAIIMVGQAFQVPTGLGLAAPAWFLAFMVVITPLVEEPIKVMPLMLKPAWKMVTSRGSALWVGFLLGVSFGLGEAGFLAYYIAQNQAYSALPWYAFTGYFNDRLLACFTHGVVTALLVSGVQRGGRFALYGFLTALGLHLFMNAPTVMYGFQWISLEWYNILLIIAFIVLAMIFERLRLTSRGTSDEWSGKEVLYWQRPDVQQHP